MSWLAWIRDLGTGPTPHRETGRPLTGYRRRRPLVGITLHESVTLRREPDAILAARGLGVHACVQRPEAGPVRITSHVPTSEACSHAGTWANHATLGLEVESEYRPADGDAAIARVGRPLDGATDVLVCRWAWKPPKARHRLYRVPPRVQLEAVWVQVREWCEAFGLPLVFPGVHTDRGFRWGRVRDCQRPGIQAHYRWHHADGLVPECYCWLRSLGWGPVAAYAETCRLAQLGADHTWPRGMD